MTEQQPVRQRIDLRYSNADIERHKDALPANYKLVLSLAIVRGNGYEEIAALLGGVPPGTVKSRLHRARYALKALMDAEGSAP